MKKIIIICFSFVLIPNLVNAQLIVDGTTGNVGVQTTGDIKSPLTIGGSGESDAKVTIEDSVFSVLALGKRVEPNGWVYSARGIQE